MEKELKQLNNLLEYYTGFHGTMETLVELNEYLEKFYTEPVGLDEFNE